MRHTPTEAEDRLWHILRDRRLVGFKFRRQVPIGPYIADFVCCRANLIIELDGNQHADNQRDILRDQELARRGFRILRIWKNLLFTEREAVLTAIHSALTEPTS